MPSFPSPRPVLLLGLLALALLLLPLYPTFALHPGITLNGVEEQRDIDPAALAYFQRLAPPDRPRRLDVDP